jgi:hypothetical protein
LVPLLLAAAAGNSNPALAEESAVNPGQKQAGAGQKIEPLLTLRGHQGRIFRLAFSPNGDRLVSTSEDRTARVWNAATGQLVLTLEGHTVNVCGLAFSPDGKRLASSSGGRGELANEPGEVIVWDAATGRKVHTFQGQSSAFYSVAFSPDSRRIAVGDAAGKVWVWDAVTGKEAFGLTGPPGNVYGVAFSPDGRHLASATGDFHHNHLGGLTLWDATTGEEVRSLQGHRGAVYSVAFNPDGKYLASAGQDQTVKVWEVATGKEALSISGHKGAAYTVAFSPDGRRLVSAGADHEAKLWDAITGRQILALPGHTAQFTVATFGRDGNRLASAGGNAVLTWDVSDARSEWRLPSGVVSGGDLEALWTALAGEDACQAYQAIWTLAGTPEQAVPFLRQRLRPAVAAVRDPRIDRLIAHLDDDRFVVREKATQLLANCGKSAGPALHQVLRNPPSLEVRRRVECLLDRLGREVLSPEQVCLLRAVEALEQMGTSAAKKMLETLAQGAPEAQLTRDAKAALERLRR